MDTNHSDQSRENNKSGRCSNFTMAHQPTTKKQIKDNTQPTKITQLRHTEFFFPKGSFLSTKHREFRTKQAPLPLPPSQVRTGNWVDLTARKPERYASLYGPKWAKG